MKCSQCNSDNIILGEEISSNMYIRLLRNLSDDTLNKLGENAYIGPEQKVEKAYSFECLNCGLLGTIIKLE